MSRIIVRNLPKYVDEGRLREHFSQKGEVTDAQIMRTRDGKSRRFAFIGYHTEGEAQEALKYFDKSFLDASRITCETARKIGDPDIPRPWSRYSVMVNEKSDTDMRLADARVVEGSFGGNRKRKKISNVNEIEEDPMLQEFLQVIQPRTKTKIWEDDVFEAVPRGKIKQKDSKKALDGDGDDERMDEQSKSEAVEPTKRVALDDFASDMDYFKSRMKKWSDSDNDDEGQWEDADGNVSGSRKLSPAKENEENEVLDKDRLFVRQIPYTATEDELEQFFDKIGKVSQVHLNLDKQTKRSKGTAYIQYAAPECAARALDELNNSIFQGRCLHVLPAERRILPGKEGTNPNHCKSFKEKREDERKASLASGNTKAQNIFFMRQDTVVEYIARKYGVSKSEFLDPESEDVAVRVALAETQALADTKKALKNAGVNVAALEEFAKCKTEGVKIKNSNHVIIVKNLPYKSTEGELTQMFRKFGSLDKIILPPTKAIALVIYLEPFEARAAFMGLLGKLCIDAPLYLQWAPVNVLDETVNANDGDSNSTVVGDSDVKKQLVEAETSDVDIDPDRPRSIYVKNLNFKTTDTSLREHFARNLKEGRVSSVKVAKNGNNSSKGFGFIEFDTVKTATLACKDLQGTVLDGHALKLKLCHANKDEKAPRKTEKGKSSTKIIVKNVAFEATRKDLRQLFSPYGKIKRLRLPKNIEHHKGFAFIEFHTKHEARSALQALSNTHLYCRRLILERAKEGESLEELRQKTAARFSNEQDGFRTKLSKKRKHTDIHDEENMEFY